MEKISLKKLKNIFGKIEKNSRKNKKNFSEKWKKFL